MDIHPSAIIEPGAQLGKGVRIGPFSIVGPEVVLGDGVELKSHVVITGDTVIGEGSQVHSFAVIGEIPQDRKFAGEKTQLRIGKRNRIREYVTINTGTAQGGGVTRVGDDGLYLAGCHIAHDCLVGDRVTMVHSAALAGHCIVEDDVIFGGLSGAHQHVRVGRGAIIGALAMAERDVLPFAMVKGPRGGIEGLNLVGLKRSGVSREDIAALQAAFAALKDGTGTFQERAARARQGADSAYAQILLDFVLGHSDRSFMTP